MCVRQSETCKKAGHKKNTTFHTILNAGVKGGTMHMDADRRACCACKKSDHDTEVVHYFVLQPSLFKVAVPN